MSRRFLPLLALAAVGFAASGCTGGDDDDDDVPQVYEFESAFEPGQSSVVYSGQTFRQVLVEEMKARIGGLTERIDTLALQPTSGEVAFEMMFYFDFDLATSGTVPLTLTTTPATAQTTFGDLSASGADLVSKIAGNDDLALQHKDWTVPGTLVGISTVGTATGLTFTPQSLVEAWIDELDARSVARANGSIGVDPVDGAPLTKVFVTPQGVDLQQLLQKFLGGAVAFSQGTDDYLDDTTAGKGLLSPNTQDGTNPYTTLEHAWDEGFGYFGAARDQMLRTDAEVADTPYRDGDSSGSIDLLKEYSFGHSANAAKRDAGSTTGTDFSGEALSAFLEGRALIAAASAEGRELTTDELAELAGHRDVLALAWEKAIAASVIHYINAVIGFGDELETSATTYDFYAHAKEWSEMKGFALALQFNPRSPVGDADFALLHQKMGDRPEFDTGDLAAYETSLLEARTILQTAYGFDAADTAAW